MSKAETGWNEGKTHRHFSAAYMPTPPGGVPKPKTDLPEGVIAFPAERQRAVADAAAILAVKERVAHDMDAMESSTWHDNPQLGMAWVHAMHQGVPSIANQAVYRELWVAEHAVRQAVSPQQTAAS